jgi:hypothetical protein
MSPNANRVPRFPSSAQEQPFGTQVVDNKPIMNKVKLHFDLVGGRNKAKTVMISDRKTRL